MSQKLRVDICNERLISRFGVDRLLLLLGSDLSRRDIDVRYRCLRFDRDTIGDVDHVPHVLEMPSGLDFRQTESRATALVMDAWLEDRPDVVVVGGWPFFELAARSPAVGVASIFIDAGAVPHDGLEGHALWPQYEVRRTRKAFLPYITRVLPISDFIAQSQTLPDRGSWSGVETVLLGADHISSLPEQALGMDGAEDALLANLSGRVRSGDKLLLNLGRFEPTGYKQSARFFDVLRAVRQKTNVTGLLLASRNEVAVPTDLSAHLVFLGKPSDSCLRAIMRIAHLGVSMSRWEGFNLPLVEMQSENRPVLVFAVGAHAEVVAHPIQLCTTTDDMKQKAALILADSFSSRDTLKQALATFPRRLPWSATLGTWEKHIRELSRQGEGLPGGRRLLLIDVTNSAIDPANSGVVRVTRQLSKRLVADDRFDVVFVRWNSEHTGYERVPSGGYLSAHDGPIDPLGHLPAGPGGTFSLDLIIYGRDPHCALPPVAFLPEVALDGTMPLRLRWLRYRGFAVSAILYDLIPLNHSKHCHPDVVRGFGPYIECMEEVDQCIAISDTTLSDFYAYLAKNDSRRTPESSSVWLPGQFGISPRIVEVPAAPHDVRILCVSTLEPRKNHRTLLEAFGELVERCDDRNWRLVLVGNRYVGNDEIPNLVESAQKAGLPVEWLGVLSEEDLLEEYGRASFTVYPSVIEGFGLPVLESLWLGRPCICSDSGVMSELARGGGCETVNILSSRALSEAMERLGTNADLYRSRCTEIATRTIANWNDYSNQVGALLAGIGGESRLPRVPKGLSEPANTLVRILDGASAGSD